MSVRLICTVVVILAVTVMSGLVQGRWTKRWGEPLELVARADALKTIPQSIGDWRMTEDNQVSQEVLDMLQCQGSVFRIYANAKTQQQVSMAVVGGPAGPISVHTPEICYSSQDFEQAAPRRTIEIAKSGPQSDASAASTQSSPPESDQFWAVVFRTSDVHSAPMSVYYAWSDGSSWQATDAPRHAFAGVPQLFKIQVASMMSADHGTWHRLRRPLFQFPP